MPTTQPTPIQNNVFTVTVAVNATGSGLLFTPDPVKLSKTPNALIIFNLISPGYYFPVNGSALVINSASASAEFPIAWYVNAATLALADFNNNRQTYKYTMTVVDAQTGRSIATDPGITNDTDR